MVKAVMLIMILGICSVGTASASELFEKDIL